MHAYQASFLQEKALGYKIIIIVKRTAAPFDILFTPSECITFQCMSVFVRERVHVRVKYRYIMDSKDRF